MKLDGFLKNSKQQKKRSANKMGAENVVELCSYFALFEFSHMWISMSTLHRTKKNSALSRLRWCHSLLFSLLRFFYVFSVEKNLNSLIISDHDAHIKNIAGNVNLASAYWEVNSIFIASGTRIITPTQKKYQLCNIDAMDLIFLEFIIIFLFALCNN